MESINVKIDDLSILNLCDDNDVNEPNENHVNDIISPTDVTVGKNIVVHAAEARLKIK